MLILSTIMPVNDNINKESFLDCFASWSGISVSNNTDTYKECLTSSGCKKVKTVCFDEMGIFAAHCSEDTPSGRWETEFILNTVKGQLFVNMSRSVTRETLNMKPHYYLPTLPAKLIKDGYGGKVCGFPVCDRSVDVSIDDAGRLSDLVNGHCENIFPVVYLSSASILNADLLASKLAGAAIVLTDSNDILASDMEEFAGSPVHLIIPGQSIKAYSNDVFHREIQADVFEFHNSTAREDEDTWFGLNAQINSIRNSELLKKYKAADSERSDIYELCENFSNERDALAEEAMQLKNENMILSARLSQLTSRSERSADSASILSAGTERELYENEFTEVLIDILRKDIANIEENSRRYHILSAIIAANPTQDKPRKMRELVKVVLKGYRSFDSSICSKLEEIGITVHPGNTHHYLQYYGDSRYDIVAASTCSDTRGGSNLAHIVANKMF